MIMPFDYHHSKIAEVNIDTAYNCTAGILLHGGSGPSSEFAGGPVIEILLAVVMSVPQGIAAKVLATVSVAHDLVPHVSAGVDSHSSSPCLNSCNEFLYV